MTETIKIPYLPRGRGLGAVLAENGGYHYAEVEITIDVYAVTRRIAAKAAQSKRGKATTYDRLIRARVLRREVPK